MMNSIMGYVYTLVFFAIFVCVLEMIIPKGNTRKYIRLVSGIILTYIVISPIVSILSDVSTTKDNISEGIETLSQTYSLNKEVIGQEQYILNLFEQGMAKDIEKRVQECGYGIDDVKVKYNLSDDNEINEITYISFKVEERINNEQTGYSVEKVNIDIAINDDIDNSSKIELSNEEEKKIKESICEAYQIDFENVYIN